jgi:hypothetical protein
MNNDQGQVPERLTPETVRERADNFLGTIAGKTFCDRSQIAGCLGKLILSVQAEAEARKDAEYAQELERLRQDVDRLEKIRGVLVREALVLEGVYFEDATKKAPEDRASLGAAIGMAQSLAKERDRLAAELQEAQAKFADISKSLALEEHAHHRTIGERDHLEDQILQTATQLGLEAEWTNSYDAGEECIEAAGRLHSELDAMSKQIGQHITARERLACEKESIRQSAIEAGCVEIEVCAGCGKPQPCPSDCPCGSGKRLINERAEAAEKRLVEIPGRIGDVLCVSEELIRIIHHYHPMSPAYKKRLRALVAQAAAEPSQPATAQVEGEPEG